MGVLLVMFTKGIEQVYRNSLYIILMYGWLHRFCSKNKMEDRESQHII